MILPSLRVVVFAALLSSASAQTPARHPGTFCDRIKALISDPAVAAAHWGISVTSLDGTSLCAVNAAQLFRPASNAKLFTASAALALLGSDHTVSTFAEIASPLQPGQTTVAGDLTLRGSGDAFLSRQPMPYVAASLRSAADLPPRNPLEAMADAVFQSGVRHIAGNIVGDDTLWPYEPIPADWSLDDILWGYGAPVSALSAEDNKLTLTVTPGPSPGSPAIITLDPASTFYTVDNISSTVAGKAPASIGIDRAPGSRILRVFGTIPLGNPSRQDIAIADPAEFAALSFKSMLEARGIVVDGGAIAHHLLPTRTESFAHQTAQPITHQGSALSTASQPKASVLLIRPYAADRACPAASCQRLAEHISPTLLQDVTLTLKVSQNLHAELLLHQLARTFGDDGSTAQGCRVVRQFLLSIGIAKDEVFLNDGSGLSTHDLVTPRALTQLLVFAATQPWFDGFKAALPIGGIDGTLAGRFAAAGSALNGRVFAKTGTLGETRALSGYLSTPAGATLVFSVIADTHAPDTTADRTIMDRIIETIAAQR